MSVNTNVTVPPGSELIRPRLITVNRLADETSPYLLQHAENPVDWYAWGEDALTARVMNENFVNVKVDREERPDVDSVYMDAAVALTGSGGWPMTVFLTPEGEPFFGGTYFPPEPRHGLPAFTQVLLAVAEAWETRSDEVRTSSANLAEHIRSGSLLAASSDPLTDELLGAAHENLGALFDPTWGGFGRAPKFPPAPVLEFLLRRGEDEMTRRTLDAMAAGGMHDLVGGGFHRYSVDARWLVPHFEKMLYDNALLASVYLHAAKRFGEPRYRAIADSTIDYVLRERTLEGGAPARQLAKHVVARAVGDRPVARLPEPLRGV